LNIFFVARLFPDQHNAGIAAAFAKDGLRAQLPEIACFAPGGGHAQGRQRGFSWNQGSSSLQSIFGHAESDAL
jgi:hypothetical protein